MTVRARTIFLGSGEFAVPIAEALLAHPQVELVGVVSAPPRARSGARVTHAPVADWARSRAGLVPLTPPRLRDPDAIEQLTGLVPELMVLADYGQIVPAAVLDLPRHGALNVHPSLLPRHRGATPIPGAILAGDTTTGVSVIRMDAGVDTGPLVAQRAVPLEGTETAPSLEHRLATLGAELLSETMGPWLMGELAVTPQPSDGATYTRPLRRADGVLRPDRPADSLERQVRAYQPWPGTYFELDRTRVIVWQARRRERVAERPGALVALGDGAPAIAVVDGTLELVEVQPAGGRRMTGIELLRGRPWLVGMHVAEPPPADAAG